LLGVFSGRDFGGGTGRAKGTSGAGKVGTYGGTYGGHTAYGIGASGGA